MFTAYCNQWIICIAFAVGYRGLMFFIGVCLPVNQKVGKVGVCVPLFNHPLSLCCEKAMRNQIWEEC